MRVLFVAPKFPVSYWGAEYVLSILEKKAAYPPLGLISVAALLPPDCEARLVDLNVEPLADDVLAWADVVLTGGMLVQADSIHEIIARAHRSNKRVIVGGPYPTTSPEACADADLVFCGEAETSFPEVFEAFRHQRAPARVDGVRPDAKSVPVPRFDLLKLSAYCTASVQFSRGCPFQCEFCDIIEIFGRTPRTKTPAQLERELELLHRLGYRGPVFMVDDNFIGNKRSALELVRRLEGWQRERSFPFDLFTEASVNLAEETDLLNGMVRAGFTSVFVGLESPSESSLREAKKRQNLALDLDTAVATLTSAGLEVMSGFIVGFDSDTPSVFRDQRRFIERQPIALAMVGLLTALPGTALTRRLQKEGRLERRASGDQFGLPNFTTKLPKRDLLSGYSDLLADLYSPAGFYRRARALVRELGPSPVASKPIALRDLRAVLRIVHEVGVRSPARRHFWSLFFLGLRHRQNFRRVFALGVWGEHMRRYTEEVVLPRLGAAMLSSEEVTAGRLERRPAGPPEMVPPLSVVAPVPSRHAGALPIHP